MDVQALAAVVTVAVAVAGGLSTLLTHWLNRRAASGRVATSEAAVLWEQSQDIRAMLLTEKNKAEEQRDRLIEGYTEQVLPVLTETNAAVTSLSASLAENIRLSREILDALRGGGYVVPAPQGSANSQ